LRATQCAVRCSGVPIAVLNCCSIRPAVAMNCSGSMFNRSRISGVSPGIKWVSRHSPEFYATVSQQGASAAAISESVGGETLGWSRIPEQSGSYSVLRPQAGPAGPTGLTAARILVPYGGPTT